MSTAADCLLCGTVHPQSEGCPGVPAPVASPERELWRFIGHVEERTRAARVVARWKRFCATQSPGDFELQAVLSKVALEILCAVEEEGGDDAP